MDEELGGIRLWVEMETTRMQRQTRRKELKECIGLSQAMKALETSKLYEEQQDKGNAQAFGGAQKAVECDAQASH